MRRSASSDMILAILLETGSRICRVAVLHVAISECNIIIEHTIDKISVGEIMAIHLLQWRVS